MKVLLAAMVCLALAACGGSQSETTTPEDEAAPADGEAAADDGEDGEFDESQFDEGVGENFAGHEGADETNAD